MTTIISGFTICLLAWPIVNHVNNFQRKTTKGTLITCMKTDGDLVIVSDKRNNFEHGFEDTAVKIFQIDDFTACGITGLAQIEDKVNGVVNIHDPRSVLKQYFRNNKFLFDETTINKIGNFLLDDLERYLTKVPIDKLDICDTDKLYTVIFFNTDKLTKVSTVLLIDVYFYRSSSNMNFKWSFLPKNHFSRSELVHFGSELYFELKDGTNKSFDYLRGDKEMMKFIANHSLNGFCNTNEGIRYLKKFIRISSETNLDLGTSKHISPTSDAFIINNQSGFKVL